VTVDPLALGTDVARATEQLLKSVETMDDAAVHAPSLLPGWTRGHVITHLARNADSYVNLLTWAFTGIETPQYPDPAQRDPDIERGAQRPAAEQLADLRAAGDRFAAAAAEMTPAAWSATVRYTNGMVAKAAHVVWARLREVEVHHVDLDVGYRPQAWSDAFTLHLLHEVVSNFSRSGPPLRVAGDDLDFSAELGGAGADGVTVRGRARELAAWLIGRSTGAALTVDPAGALPPVPSWK
jgi:maleylpyruvate isomerase